ncbi:MAG: PKD domain-containing protein, partial [Chloroflexota bacterium]|nr:PKD domain-containing protein [Chloroflexota bacterium]
TYAWDFGDGNTGSGENPTHTFAAVGDYTAMVTATNSVSEQSTTTEVTVDETIAGLSADNDSPTSLGETTSFTATVSAGSNVAYTWDFGDGNTGSGANPTHIYSSVGSFVAKVTASNSVSEEMTSTIVTIQDIPIEGLTAENDSPTFIGSVTTLSASVTSGSNVTYEWDFGDGSLKETGAVVNHVYPAVGMYFAKVTAKNGVSAPYVTTVVTIINYENYMPLVFFMQQ